MVGLILLASLCIVCLIAYSIERYQRIEYQKYFQEKLDECEKFKKLTNRYYDIWCLVNANSPRHRVYTVDLWNEEDSFYSVTYRFNYDDGTYSIDVKRFFFNPNDDADRIYAKNCAEELCDKLNEKI